MTIRSTSRPVLNFRRFRIDRGVEQPGSSSVKPHIAINQLVLTFVQQLYSRKLRSHGTPCYRLQNMTIAFNRDSRLAPTIPETFPEQLR
jgi:hypothetical protein